MGVGIAVVLSLHTLACEAFTAVPGEATLLSALGGWGSLHLCARVTCACFIVMSVWCFPQLDAISVASCRTALHHLCVHTLQEFVKETYFNKERELINDRPEEIVEQKERIVSVTPANPCSCVTGNEYSIGGLSGLPRSRRASGEAGGYSNLPKSRQGSGQEMF